MPPESPKWPALTMVAGPTTGTAYLLNRACTTLGRDLGCDIILERGTVSRRHALIIRRGDGFAIEDLGSTSGTLLNGQVLRGRAILGDGDRIDIGGCLLSYGLQETLQGTKDVTPETIVGQRDSTISAMWALATVRPEEKLAALLDITRSLVGAIDQRDVLEKALDAMLRLFPQAERCLALLQDEADGSLAPAAVKTRRGGPSGPTLSRAIIEHVIVRGKAVLCHDVKGDDRFGGSKSVHDALIRTLICVPLRDHTNRPAGILQLDASDPHAGFTHEDLDVLTAVAGPIGLAVDNARLLGKARSEQRRLKFLAEVGEGLATSLDIAETLGGLARRVVPYLADLCLVDLVDQDGSVRRVAAAYSDLAMQSLADELRMQHLTDPGPAMDALRTGRTVDALAVADARRAETIFDDEPAVVSRLAPRSYLCLPLIACGRTLGVITLITTGDRRLPGGADRATAEEVARRAAAATENSRLYREVQEAGRAKDRFLAVLSHELRTPLTPVLLAVSTLLDGTAPADRPTLEMVRRNVELEARLIDDLLDVARIGRDLLRLAPEVLDAHEAIRRAVEICGEEVNSAGLIVDLEISAEPRYVRGDPSRLLQVFWNLIRNAARFTPAGGRLAITTHLEAAPAGTKIGSNLIIEFQDNGFGIESGQEERIFEPFEQGVVGLHGRQGGLGLGLAIGRAIAEAHGGRLTVESPGLGLGSTFRLALPMAPASAPSRTAQGPLTPTNQVAPILKVLLVEDNRDTLRYLAMVLRLRGHEVTEAANLDQARAAAVGGFGLLVSDIELPDGTGLELIRELGGAKVAAIAMSGYGSEEDVKMSLDAGFAEHLTKPVTLQSLEAAILRVAAAG